MKLSAELSDYIDRILTFGPKEVYDIDEAAIGFRLVPVGSVPWLPEVDWVRDDIVSTDGKTVRLLAIRARKPGTGALSRLVTALLRAGLKIQIVEPLHEMEAILRRWGWRRYLVDRSEGVEEHWRPTKVWTAGRI